MTTPTYSSSSLGSLPLSTSRRGSTSGAAPSAEDFARPSASGSTSSTSRQHRSQSVSEGLGDTAALFASSAFGSSASSHFSSSSGSSSSSAFPSAASGARSASEDSAKAFEALLQGPAGGALLRFLQTNTIRAVDDNKARSGIGARLAASRGKAAPRAASAAPQASDEEEEEAEDAQEPQPQEIERMGRSIVRRAIQSSGSMSGWWRTQHWVHARNGNEARSICHALDLLITEVNHAEDLQAVECMARRLAGVQKADASGNWNICKALELAPDGDLLSLAEMSKTIRVANQYAQVDGAGGRKRGGGEPKNRGGFTWRGGRGRGRGGRQSSSTSSSSSGRGGRGASAQPE